MTHPSALAFSLAIVLLPLDTRWDLHGAVGDQSRTMLPEINLQGDVDIAALSPLLRGMLLSVAYADGEGGIGLTATGAMNRKFVHWAAVHFLWPGFTAEDLYSMNKVLNESDMPPLWVVRDMARHLKLLRRKKDVLLPTRRGREFLVNPQAFFDLVATDYLYSYVHATEREEEVRARLRWWRRIQKHAQRFGGVRSAVHRSLLLSIVGLREQLAHQLDEHRHRIVRELLAKLDDLSHDQSVATAGVEVVGKPGRRCVALPDHLVPPSG